MAEFPQTEKPSDESRQQPVERVQSDPAKEKVVALKRLSDAFETLLQARMGGVYAQRGEPEFSGDGASLYVLASFKDESGLIRPELVKIGWGEFSRQTFEGNQYPAFRDIPFDVYCVSQRDSFLADSALTKGMDQDPAKYLSSHTLFVAKGGQVVSSERISTRETRLEQKIVALPHEEMLRIVRNLIINHRVSPEDFSTFLQELPNTPASLAQYMYDLEKTPWLSAKELERADELTKKREQQKYLMGLISGMGVETLGIAIGDRKAMESVLALKNSFNFESKSF